MVPSFQDKNSIAIIGGGPAGIFCAISLIKLFKENNYSNYKISIFEKGKTLATLLPTGNGRCNITNNIEDIKEFASNYPRGEKFLYSIFSKFSNFDTVNFFNDIAISTYAQEDGRIFPVSNSSKDVRNKLLKCILSNNKVKIINTQILNISELDKFNNIVISTGSRGSENIIKQYGHTCIPFKKSLCSLIIKDFIFPKGVSVKSLDGDFIFTDCGISGPLAFKISSLKSRCNFPFDIEIKFFDPDNIVLDAKKFPKKSIGSILSKYIPKSLAHCILPDYSKNISEVSNKNLISYSKLNLTVIGVNKKGEIVNSGGVDLNEIDKNCKSKIVPNLWFCGEVLNIDGFCGGFNLQNCWSTGYVVANNIVDSIIKNVQ